MAKCNVLFAEITDVCSEILNQSPIVSYLSQLVTRCYLILLSCFHLVTSVRLWFHFENIWCPTTEELLQLQTCYMQVCDDAWLKCGSAISYFHTYLSCSHPPSPQHILPSHLCLSSTCQTRSITVCMFLMLHCSHQAPTLPRPTLPNPAIVLLSLSALLLISLTVTHRGKGRDYLAGGTVTLHCECGSNCLSCCQSRLGWSAECGHISN